MPLRALTVDFNSYFASVEQQERPELRGKPVGIVPVMTETTGCVAISIEAKQLGLVRNVRVAEARRLVPGLRIVEARPELYIAYHHRLVELIESCLHIEKVQSIDEVTCALSGRWAERDRAVATARQIREKILREAGPCLRCSIGIAPNWLLAKVASNMEKPDGLVVLEDADIPQQLLRLAPGDISGIGPNMQGRLAAHGITTMAQLYAAKKAELRGLWRGVMGERMWRLLHGEDQPFFEQEDGQTIGHGQVLPPARRHEAAALATLHRLLQKAALRLRDAGQFSGALHVSVRCVDGTRWDDQLTFNETQDTLALTHALSQLWARRPAGLSSRRPLKVGVMLLRLLRAAACTPDLFAPEQELTRGRLLTAMDTLNRTLGKNSVYLGGAHGATDHTPMRIAFTRIPRPELEEIDRSRNRRLQPTQSPAA